MTDGFSYIVCDGDVPERWTHGEFNASDGTVGPIPFDFFWVDLASGVPPLIVENDRFISELILSLR